MVDAPSDSVVDRFPHARRDFFLDSVQNERRETETWLQRVDHRLVRLVRAHRP